MISSQSTISGRLRAVTITTLCVVSCVATCARCEPPRGSDPSMADAVTAEGSREPIACDPARVLGHEACVRCHAAEVQVWKQTAHHATFEALHKKPAAKEIARRVGETSIKRGRSCVPCHYTLQHVEGTTKAVSGISCESCHGHAADWITIHADYGGGSASRLTESPEHRLARSQRSIAAGMRNPANLYLIARQCFACHTVPSEHLVNTGGHAASSREFELVAWSQGSVRHHFVSSEGVSNGPNPIERLRVMYIVGAMTDLEFSLRAVAQATVKDTFGLIAARRVATAARRLQAVQVQLENTEIQAALDTVAKLRLETNRAELLDHAADQVGRAADRFATTARGETLAAVDSMLPTPAQYK